MITAAGIDHLMNRGWPAAHSTEFDGWLVRRAAGVTLRANSVLPAGAPYDLGKALDYVETLYQAHGITPSFQISPAAQPTDLDTHLAARGYAVKNPTLVQCAQVADVLAALPAPTVEVNISPLADDAWTQFWWQNDGRGGPAEQAVARQILARGAALYARVEVDGRIAAIGRLALVGGMAATCSPHASGGGASSPARSRPPVLDGTLPADATPWSGLYCIAVDPAFRRRGFAQAIIHGLLSEATNRGIGQVFLSVLADNVPALALYARFGFSTVSRYHYRTLPSAEVSAV